MVLDTVTPQHDISWPCSMQLLGHTREDCPSAHQQDLGIEVVPLSSPHCCQSIWITALLPERETWELTGQLLGTFLGHAALEAHHEGLHSDNRVIPLSMYFSGWAKVVFSGFGLKWP